jgi:integrase
MNNAKRGTSYDVRVWKISTYQGKRGRTYTVRWEVEGERKRSTFKTRALAESFRAELLAAARSGQAFDVETGLPLSKLRREEPQRSWYEHACAFVDMKWSAAAGKSRASIADALATVTPALLTTDEGAPRPKVMRQALYAWAFNAAKRKASHPPNELAKTVRWLERNTLPLSALDEPAMMRRALDALASKQDGSRAAANTLMRKRAVFHNALAYAVEQGYLASNPLSRVKWTAPKTAETVDPRVLVDRKRAERLLRAVAEQGMMGKRLVAFFGCIYYAAMRPAEVVDLREADLSLPDADGEWGEILLNRSSPAVARAWTDSGRRRESRQLKHRAREEVRPVPCHPSLVQLLQAHVKEFGTARDGRIFPGMYGGPLSESVYGRIWHKARDAALTPAEASSPLAGRPYDLRHACVTSWLNATGDPAQVAEWAGHSVNVLLRVYVRCIAGRDEIAKKRIERALAEEVHER